MLSSSPLLIILASKTYTKAPHLRTENSSNAHAMNELSLLTQPSEEYEENSFIRKKIPKLTYLDTRLSPQHVLSTDNARLTGLVTKLQ